MSTKNAGAALRIAGFPDLTADHAVQFRTRACAALNGRSPVEVDLSKTTHMDCAGVAALIAVRNLVQARQGQVRLIHPTPAVQRLFDILHAGDLFEIVPVMPQRTTAPSPGVSASALPAQSSAGTQI